VSDRIYVLSLELSACFADIFSLKNEGRTTFWKQKLPLDPISGIFRIAVFMLSSCLQLLCSKLFQKHILLLLAFLPGLPREPIPCKALRPGNARTFSARQIVYAPCTSCVTQITVPSGTMRQATVYFSHLGCFYVLPLVGQSSVQDGLLARQLYGPPAPFQATGPNSDSSPANFLSCMG